MKILLKLAPGAQEPTRGSNGAAGWDLYNNESRNITLQPGERHKFETGVSVSLPRGTFLKIESRSGLAFKNGILAIGGVIDEDYRGEIGVILVNLGENAVRFAPGERIAQMILHSYGIQDFINVEDIGLDDLPGSDRGGEGFGSTGL